MKDLAVLLLFLVQIPERSLMSWAHFSKQAQSAGIGQFKDGLLQPSPHLWLTVPVLCKEMLSLWAQHVRLKEKSGMMNMITRHSKEASLTDFACRGLSLSLLLGHI